MNFQNFFSSFIQMRNREMISLARLTFIPSVSQKVRVILLHDFCCTVLQLSLQQSLCTVKCLHCKE